MDEKAAKTKSAPAKPAAVSFCVISSSLLFRLLRGAGGRLMKITLVGQCRMLAERAVHLPFRNQTYGKMADFRGFLQFEGEILNTPPVSGVCTVHEKNRVHLAHRRHFPDGAASVYGEGG